MRKLCQAQTHVIKYADDTDEIAVKGYVYTSNFYSLVKNQFFKKYTSTPIW